MTSVSYNCTGANEHGITCDGMPLQYGGKWKCLTGVGDEQNEYNSAY